MTLRKTTVLLTALLLVAATLAVAVEPFNGKDLGGWQTRPSTKIPQGGFWTVGTAAIDANDPKELTVQPGGKELVNAKAHGLDIFSEAKFGDARIELEVMVPKGSNSGIYLMGEYEIQVLDSFGKEKIGPGDMGGVYGQSAPRVNASKAPGQWQAYVIEYVAPRYDAQGNKTANMRILKIVLNDQVLHESVELPKQTPGGVTGKEAAQGPLMFQGNHGPVAYRNIRVTPLGK